MLLIDAIDPYGLKYVERCARILSSKIERGQKVYCIDYFNTISLGTSCGDQIGNCLDNDGRFTIYYRSYLPRPIMLNDTVKGHRLFIDKRYNVAVTKKLIAMIIGDSLIEAQQHLRSILALVEAAELPGGGREITCGNCQSQQGSDEEKMILRIDEPSWSNCVDCELK